ncbi:hypothetical protein JW707_03610 [Candidatus Woesearchaeota archaeon]|nr:hypothetical protein [Candidatus Woesearchaeota archaeon]
MGVYQTTSGKAVEFPEGLERVVAGEPAIAEKFVNNAPGMEDLQCVFYLGKVNGDMHAQCRTDFIGNDKKKGMMIVEVHSDSSPLPGNMNSEEMQDFYLGLYINMTSVARDYFDDNWVECLGEVKLK